jgi:hypothetical protein
VSLNLLIIESEPAKFATQDNDVRERGGREVNEEMRKSGWLVGWLVDR